MKPNKQIVVPPGEGTTFTVLGSAYTIKIRGAETNNAFSLTEVVAPPQAFVPLHVHTREDESFYVLEGALEIRCGDHTFNAPPGTVVFLPRNVPHAYRNAGSVPARVLVTLTPAGFEDFLEEASLLPPDQPPDIKKLAAVGRKYGLELVPPPVQG
ncbi:MAG: Cupin 2 conserved barrel domain protein [Pedosphaera sp.]|nr:Cupin 2 conserved barrel domain protein [Pedosphaera sp.]